MANLEQLKQKYANVLQVIQSRNVRLDHLHVENNKLVMQAAAPNDEIKNEVWNVIKSVDPRYCDLNCDISIDSSLPAPTTAAPALAGQIYTVQPGDSLFKIAKRFYGEGNRYMAIFEANQDKLTDPNKISGGQELNINRCLSG